MKQSQIAEIVFKLAHFNPTCTDDYGNQVIDYLIMDTLASYGTDRRVSAPEIKAHIQKFFFVEFEEAEINNASRRLHQKNLIKIERPKKTRGMPLLSITETINKQINQNINEVKKLEREVMDLWKSDLLAKYQSSFPVETHLDAIERNLKEFLSRMVVKHGVECVELLYPKSAKSKEWMNQIKGNIFSKLQKINPEVDTILKIEIPLFFVGVDQKRHQYIANIFNASFFWHLAQVDESFSHLLKSVTKGQKLFLDNNILYDLVGLHGIVALQAIHRLLSFANELGYKLYVTTTTIGEFKESLRRHKVPIVPRNLARIALDNLQQGSFLSEYWKEFVDEGKSIDEFIAQKSYIEEILKGLNVTETSDFQKQIQESKELKHEENALNSIAKHPFSPFIVYHDTFHRVLINRIRGKKRYEFHDAIAWFLTNDSKLPAYDQVARSGENYLPFCLTTQHWIQINRPLLARTKNLEDYDKSFHALVTEPFVRSMMAMHSLDETYSEVTTKLARYKNMQPEIVSTILADKHFIVSLKNESNEEKREKEIENKFINIAKRLLGEKKDLAQKYEDETLKRKIVEDNYADKMLNYERKISDATQQIGDLSQALSAEKLRIDKIEKEKTETIRELDKQRATTRWLISGFVLVILSYLLWSGNLGFLSAWINSKQTAVQLTLASQLFLLISLLIYPLYKNWLALGALLVPILLAILNLSQ